jgi:hypothetical protein
MIEGLVDVEKISEPVTRLTSGWSEAPGKAAAWSETAPSQRERKDKVPFDRVHGWEGMRVLRQRERAVALRKAEVPLS